MKTIILFIALATLLLTGGCILEDGHHRGAAVGVYGEEYPNHDRGEYHHPYDRDRDWDRR